MRPVFLCILFCALSQGCDQPSATQATATKPRVVATTTIIGDLVRQIGGEDVALTVIMPAGVDPHSFKPSTADMAEVARADLVFYNGLHLEGKMVELLEQKLGGRAFAITRDMPRGKLLAWAEGESGAYDPHVWFDPTLWVDAAKLIGAELAKKDPAKAPDYHNRTAAAVEALMLLDGEVRGKLAMIPAERRVLITSHDAFSYFGRAYDIDVRGLQGISTETQAGLTNITAAVDHIVAKKIPAIFVESSVPHSTIERVVADCKARGVEVTIGGELYSDAMGSPGERPGYAVDTYAGMMRYNVDLLVNGLR